MTVPAVLRRLLLIVVFMTGVEGWCGDPGGSGPLHDVGLDGLGTILSAGTEVMIGPAAIEQFLKELDGEPPDWAKIHGDGHHDPAHDDRLFALNRERDAARQGRAALSKRIAFLWMGSLSRYDADIGGFPVALGPNLIRTAWGLVRFKPEDVPANLTVVAEERDRITIERLLAQGLPVEIDVVMGGRLVPEESIVYDFSHDEEGVGLIMPFVRVEQVLFVMPSSDGNQ